jgi:hypothetical protein
MIAKKVVTAEGMPALVLLLEKPIDAHRVLRIMTLHIEYVLATKRILNDAGEKAHREICVQIIKELGITVE